MISELDEFNRFMSKVFESQKDNDDVINMYNHISTIVRRIIHNEIVDKDSKDFIVGIFSKTGRLIRNRFMDPELKRDIVFIKKVIEIMEFSFSSVYNTFFIGVKSKKKLGLIAQTINKLMNFGVLYKNEEYFISSLSLNLTEILFLSVDERQSLKSIFNRFLKLRVFGVDKSGRWGIFYD